MHSQCRARPLSKDITALTISHRWRTKMISLESKSQKWNAHSASLIRSSLMFLSRNSLLRVNMTSIEMKHRENCNSCISRSKKLSKNWICYTHKWDNVDSKCPLKIRRPIHQMVSHSTQAKFKVLRPRQTSTRWSVSWRIFRGNSSEKRIPRV